MTVNREFSLKWVGGALIVGILSAILIEMVGDIINYGSFFKGTIDSFELTRRYETTQDTLFLAVNLVIIIFLFYYFFARWREDKANKIIKIGFITSIIAFVLHVANIIVFIIAEVKYYKLLLTPGTLYGSLVIGILFTITYCCLLTSLWISTKANYQASTITKILSYSIILFGILTLILAFEPLKTLVSLSPSTGSWLTLHFFDGLFDYLYEVIGVIAGVVILFTSSKTA